MIIRHEEPRDKAAIRFVNEQAFGGSSEANAIEQLRDRDQLTISLVAVRDDNVIGCILFTPAMIESADRVWPTLGLALLAVLPDHQRQGIGSAMMKAGLDECRHLGHERVIVLGHPDYYPRFGFVSARRFNIRCEWDVPENAFMVLELHPGAFDHVSGLAKYQPEWSGV